MSKIYITEIKNRKDYISVDKQTVISGDGEILNIGDIVNHDDENAGTAIIKSFDLDIQTNDIIAITDKGKARICYLTKIKK